MSYTNLLRQAGLLPPEPPTRLEQREREGKALSAFLRNGPYESLATHDEVLEIACRSCGAEPGQPCATTLQRPSLLWTVFRGFGSIHLRRYQDRTHDPPLAVTQLALFPLPPAPLRHRFEYMNGGPCPYSNTSVCAGCGLCWYPWLTKAQILAAGIFEPCPGEWP
jgi:hypothetical protein